MPTSPMPSSVARRRRGRRPCSSAPWSGATAAARLPAAAGRRPDQPAVRRPAVPVVRRPSGHHLRRRAGTPVRAAAAGTVTFSGVVVDVRYVVVRHADGLLATYGGLSSTASAAAATRSSPGRSSGAAEASCTSGCAPGRTPTSTRSRCSASWSCRRTSCPTDGTPVARRPSRCCDAARYDRPSAHRPVGRGSLNRPPHCGRLLAPVGGTTAEGEPRWLSSRCASCSKLACTSVTRPAVGTRRCAASSSASATASTSSTWSRRCRASRRPTASFATSSPAAAC